MKNAAVVGGSNGIGLSVTMSLNGYDRIYIIDRQNPDMELLEQNRENNPKTEYVYIPFDLQSENYEMFDCLEGVKTLIITAGIGRLSLFGETREEEIDRSFRVNTIGPMRIIHHFYDKLNSSTNDMYCAVMVSISGHISSPFFSIYSATKAALHRFIESVNVELEKAGARNRILEVSPGSLKGTSFNGGKTDVSQTLSLAKEIIDRMDRRETLFIPQWEEIFKDVVGRYQRDPRHFGLESYEYKLRSGRIQKK